MKCLFGIFNSSKKQMKKIQPIYYGTSSRIVFLSWKNWRHQKDISNFLTLCFSSCQFTTQLRPVGPGGASQDFVRSVTLISTRSGGYHITKYWSSWIFGPSYSPATVIIKTVPPHSVVDTIVSYYCIYYAMRWNSL